MEDRQLEQQGGAASAKARGEAIAQAVDEVDRRVGIPVGTVILLLLAGAYFLVGAVDALPDFIPVVGELDDGLAMYTFLRSLSRLTGWGLGFGR